MRYFILICMLFICMCAGVLRPVQAAEISLKDIQSMPILYNGRLQPIKSFATDYLSMIDAPYVYKTNATDTVMGMMIDPEKGLSLPIYRVKDQAVKTILSLRTDNDYFSLLDILDGFADKQELVSKLSEMNESELTRSEKHLLDVYYATLMGVDISRSLTLFLPLLPKNSEQENPELISFLEAQKTRAELQAELQGVLSEKGTNLEDFTEDEVTNAASAMIQDQMSFYGQTSRIFKVIPTGWDTQGLSWLSPWGVVSEDAGSPLSARIMDHWQNLVNAYFRQDGTLWNTTRSDLLLSYNEVDGVSQSRLQIESAYNFVPFNALISLIYLVAAVLISISFRFEVVATPLGKKLIKGVLVSGVSIHFVMILIRCLIMERPPIGTIYESIIAVSFCLALFMVLSDWVKRLSFDKGMKVAVLLFSTFLILLASLIGQNGSTLMVLDAVLNTHFWLATHVVVITLGYAASVLCGLYAFVLLGKLAFLKDHVVKLDQEYKYLYALSILALMLTTTGTLLGGVWADQSWGRFWGWDPKENGALLIVLWLSWLVHARITKLISNYMYAVLMTPIISIVALAWFGVNLLSVGLHSYGFTQGLASLLFGFILIQILASCILVWQTRSYIGNET